MAPLGIKVYTGNWQSLTMLRGNADQESPDGCRFYSSRELFLKIDSEASPSHLIGYDEQSV